MQYFKQRIFKKREQYSFLGYLLKIYYWVYSFIYPLNVWEPSSLQYMMIYPIVKIKPAVFCEQALMKSTFEALWAPDSKVGLLLLTIINKT